jgi:hypothetical protein
MEKGSCYSEPYLMETHLTDETEYCCTRLWRNKDGDGNEQCRVARDGGVRGQRASSSSNVLVVCGVRVRGDETRPRACVAEKPTTEVKVQRGVYTERKDTA